MQLNCVLFNASLHVHLHYITYHHKFPKNFASLFIQDPFSNSKIISPTKILAHATLNSSCDFMSWQIMVVKQALKVFISR